VLGSLGHWQGIAREVGVMVVHGNEKMGILDAEKNNI